MSECSKNGEQSMESGWQPLFHELEDTICEWTADRRVKALIVLRADIQAFALIMQLYISQKNSRHHHY